MYDCIVIGGGISGISFAHKLKRKGRSVLILEKKTEIGGQVQTHRAGLSPDFWMELGAHTCYNTYTNLLTVVDELELADQLQALRSCPYVLYKEGQVKSVMSEIHFLSLLLRGSRVFFSSQKDKTVREYFRPIVGGLNYDRLFSKLFQAVISQRADDYPAALFLKRRKGRRKDVPRKFSFSGGLQFFLQSMLEKGSLPVRYGCEVIDVEKEADHYRIQLAGGEILESRTVAFAASADVTARLIRSIEPGVAAYLQAVPMAYSRTLNIVVKKERLKHLPPVAGLIPLSDEFLSIVSRDVVEHPELRSFSFHTEGVKRTEEETRALLCRVLSIHPDEVLESVSSSHVLPSLRLSHVDIIRKVEELRTQNDLFLLGNYYYGLSLEDCIHRSTDEAERYLKG